ncbi:hypothetical protein GF369_03600, partial [Candidatus Peregrinibacteria bacterium]|nr:hypothetical protein [Candidatus Peregrinibacteria bacterium]
MNKFLTVLNFLLLTTLIILTLYVFDIISIPFLEQEDPLPEQSITQEEEPTGTTPDQPKVSRTKSYEELMEKADVYFENGLYDLAIDSYTQASQKAELNKQPLLKIAAIQLLQREYEKAKEMSLHILDIDEHSGLAKLYLGQAYIGLEEFSNAKSTFDSINSDDQKVQYYQGILALFFEEYERGRGLLETAANKTTADETIARYALSFVNAMNEFDRYDAGLNSHLRVLTARSFAQANQPQLAKETIWPVLEK